FINHLWPVTPVYLGGQDIFDELKLFGILWDPKGESSVLINDQIMREGESISGFVVQSIERDSVVIYKNGKEYIMRLSVEEKKGAVK
ncbi:MAG: hypothetical protein ACFFDT_35715, partial [Candidatus Hodarchaeota archaeon]